MPFTASASPTAGLTAYSLDRPAKNLDPNSVGVVFARSVDRWFGKKRKAARAADSSVRKAHTMTSDIITYDDALGALHKSIDSAFEAPEGERRDLIHANIDEFCAYTGELAKAAMSESFELGVVRDYATFSGFEGPEPLAKSLNDVSSMASLLQQAEWMEKRWLGKTDGGPVAAGGWGEASPSEPLVKAYGDWILAGKTILRGIIDDCMPSADAEAADADLGKAADPEQLAKAAGALRDAVMRLTASGPRRLAKAEGGEGGGGAPPSEEEIAQMNPIEAVGRLAAGIVMIADQMLGGAEGAEEEEPEEDPEGEDRMSEDGSEAEGDGAAPPPAKGEGVTGERNTEEREEDGGERAPPPFRRREDEAEKMDKGALSKVLKRIDALESENASLKKNLSAISNGPAPAKGRLRVVDKAKESSLSKSDGDVDMTEVAERLEKMDPEARAAELIRIAHSRPAFRIG